MTEPSPSSENQPLEVHEFELLIHNPLSWLGGVIAAGSGTVLVILLILQFTAPSLSPYLGIVTFLVLPAVLVAGLLLVPLGMAWNRRRLRSPQVVRAGVAMRPFPSLDLNIPEQRHRAALFLAATAGVVVLLGVVSYRGFEFTESVSFCGQVCHQVMEPEFVAYQSSPHARVKCVDCHIGPGATWLVRSKITGIGQVVAVLTNSYPRPIPLPIENLRPARETCEQCHWPEKFYGDQVKTIPHFSSDAQNTGERIFMIVRTGGVGTELRAGQGIHYWHIGLGNRIEYVATDPAQQDIPWVRVTRSSGEVVEYLRRDSSLTPEEMARLPRREMDCMDCHSRPTHVFESPTQAVDEALAAGKLDRSLPYIRRQAVELLSQSYPTIEEAVTALDAGLTDYYRTSYPDVYATRADAVRQAVRVVQDVYRTNTFPKMNVNWQTYPDNIGHKESAGCFRCHDLRHLSTSGDPVPFGCDLCHSIPTTVAIDEPFATNLVSLPPKPLSHQAPDWSIRHGLGDQKTCHQCHQQDFCTNGACHGPEWTGRLYAGGQPCPLCHQSQPANPAPRS
jgi:hypothetical protein